MAIITTTERITKEPETVAERIRYLRQHNNVTQQEMADIMQIHRVNFSRKETGGHPFSADQIALVGLYFNVNMNWLFFGEGQVISKARRQ